MFSQCSGGMSDICRGSNSSFLLIPISQTVVQCIIYIIDGLKLYLRAQNSFGSGLCANVPHGICWHYSDFGITIHQLRSQSSNVIILTLVKQQNFIQNFLSPSDSFNKLRIAFWKRFGSVLQRFVSAKS